MNQLLWNFLFVKKSKEKNSEVKNSTIRELRFLYRHMSLQMQKQCFPQILITEKLEFLEKSIDWFSCIWIIYCLGIF